MTTGWTEADIPDQSGRTVLVTGASSGLGLRSAKVLTAKGARVLFGCRSQERGEQAIYAAGGGELVLLDLADLDSVRQAAAVVRDLTGDRLDILMNNAAVMAPPQARTRDGFELQFGTNYLGHAALTWLLMPALRGAGKARVVTLSSLTARGQVLDLDDPNFERRRYRAGVAYGRSKLANQTFALELDRRLRAAEEDVISVTAHPGFAMTGLLSSMGRSYPEPLRSVIGSANQLSRLLRVGQDVRHGALPQLFAATAAEVNGGDYIGPAGLGQLRGRPTFHSPLDPALDRRTGAALWELTAKLTGVTPEPA